MLRCFLVSRERLQAIWRQRKVQATVVFVVFNVVFPSADILSDFFTAIDLSKGDHQYWCGITIFWMFAPFIFNLLIYILKSFKKPGHVTNGFYNVLLHFPFILPITNSLLAIQLLKMDLTNPENSAKIEKIKKTAAISGLYESFLESVPQLVTQIHMILCTGQTNNIQIATIVIHIFTLTLKACKSFFVQRPFSEADPDPNIHMLLLLFSPMMVNVVNGTVQWTIIAGLLKLPGCCVCMLVLTFLTWMGLNFYQKHIRKEESNKEETYNYREPGVQKFENRRESVKIIACNKFQAIVNSKVDDGYFALKASLTSVWLPCVVGRHRYTFLISSIISLVTRSLALLGAVLYSSSNLYAVYFQKRAFLLHCQTKDILENLNLTSCFGLSSCFNSTHIENTPLVQLHRECGNDDEELHIKLFINLILIFLMLLSGVATYFLHRISDYSTMYEMSKCGFKPIIHRSLIFQLILNGSHKKLQEVAGIIMNVESKKPLKSKKNIEESQPDNEDELLVETMLDRQNSDGESPLHFAVLKTDLKAVKILLDSGALVQKDSTNQHPLVAALENDEATLLEYNTTLKLKQKSQDFRLDLRLYHHQSLGNDLSHFEMLIKYANKKQIKKAFQEAIECNYIVHLQKLLYHHEGPAPFISNILLGDNSRDQIDEKFNVIGEGEKKMRSIRVNFTMKWVAGLEVDWSDGSKNTIGIASDKKDISESTKVNAPQEGNFTFVRGKTKEKFIVAMAFDTLSSSGVVERGEWIGDGGGDDEVHTLSMLDCKESPVQSILDGFKGDMHANLLQADLLEGTFDYKMFLTNLQCVYLMKSNASQMQNFRISQFPILH